ncbi:MAG: hypothetical protein HC923_00300 [Myxococcales bacterium]|nr:hypothetical protein [Myxococcales bacterium]
MNTATTTPLVFLSGALVAVVLGTIEIFGVTLAIPAGYEAALSAVITGVFLTVLPADTLERLTNSFKKGDK